MRSHADQATIMDIIYMGGPPPKQFCLANALVCVISIVNGTYISPRTLFTGKLNIIDDVPSDVTATPKHHVSARRCAHASCFA